jgi:hypothetical protein
MFAPGKVTSSNEGNIHISTEVAEMAREATSCDVLGGINPTKPVLKQGFYSIPELSAFFEFERGLLYSLCALYSALCNRRCYNTVSIILFNDDVLQYNTVLFNNTLLHFSISFL